RGLRARPRPRCRQRRMPAGAEHPRLLAPPPLDDLLREPPRPGPGPRPHRNELLMPITVDDLLDSARAGIRRLGPHETRAAYRRGALLIDIRPTVQRRWEGEIPGALVIE